MSGALAEAAKSVKTKTVYSKHLKRKVPNVEQDYEYSWDGTALNLAARGLGKPWAFYMQGEEGSELYDQLEAADTNWEVNEIIRPYEDMI